VTTEIKLLTVLELPMLTARYAGHRSIRIEEHQADPPAAGEVQIAVAYTGLCGTDLHILHGHLDARISPPQIIGHEMSGTIAVVGDQVEGWSVGDPVTVMPLIWDGICPACVAGHAQVCHKLALFGIDSPGSLQERWNVPAHTLVGLPKELELQDAALVEPTAVAVHDVRRGGVQRGDKVVVIGGGPIGVLIAFVARELGAEPMIIEIDEQRLATVSGLGFRTLNPSATDQEGAVNEWTDGAGADVVFEVSGSSVAVLSATALAKVRGRIVVVAIHPLPREIDLQRVFLRELTIVGARVYERDDFITAVDLLSRGAVPAASLITTIVPLRDAPRALDELASGRAMKILIEVGAGS
jgi:2-desacetyl-2-hydroxyethyl bacteriochlorophyllide A dehydrogenase